MSVTEVGPSFSLASRPHIAAGATHSFLVRPWSAYPGMGHGALAFDGAAPRVMPPVPNLRRGAAAAALSLTRHQWMSPVRGGSLQAEPFFFCGGDPHDPHRDAGIFPQLSAGPDRRPGLR